jgi:hypothetical protein
MATLTMVANTIPVDVGLDSIDSFLLAAQLAWLGRSCSGANRPDWSRKQPRLGTRYDRQPLQEIFEPILGR